MTCTTAKHALIVTPDTAPDSTIPPIRLVTLSRALFFMLERQKQRKALLDLDDRLLRDMGITREQAWASSRKWFWQK